MSIFAATIGVWFVTLLWVSWFQTVKHIKKFPVDAFITLMYAISVPIVWISIFIGNGTMIPEGVCTEICSNVVLAIGVIACGFVFGIAMQMHLTIVKKVGLILSTSVSATCAILGGTIVSILFAGVPQGVSIVILIIASLLLICATITCQYAGYQHDKASMMIEHTSSRIQDILMLAFINLILMSSYPLANSLGLRTELNPNAFSSLTCMGLVVIGAFLGALIVTIYKMHQRPAQLFRKVEVSYKKLFILAGIAALCHFGGNILHAIFAPVLSVTIATAMGNSYHVWIYVWGLLYGEFKGASLKTYGILGSGVLMFLAGVLLLSWNIA